MTYNPEKIDLPVLTGCFDQSDVTGQLLYCTVLIVHECGLLIVLQFSCLPFKVVRIDSCTAVVKTSEICRDTVC